MKILILNLGYIISCILYVIHFKMQFKDNAYLAVEL